MPWWVKIHRLSKRYEALSQRPWIRIAGTLGMVTVVVGIVVHAVQLRGVLVGLVTFAVFAPLAAGFAVGRPFSRPWVYRSRIVQSLYPIAFVFADSCLAYRWSTRTCALVTGAFVVATAAAARALAALFRKREAGNAD